MTELLSPAGSLEKLKIACLYGANAVYLAGQKFGLRAAADNFTHWELAEGVKFAHERHVKCYVVLNSFLFDSDLADLPEFISYLENLNVDAVIVSDPGVVSVIKRMSSIPIHLSTQATCLNAQAALLWKQLGVDRVILGREASLMDAKIIKETTGLEVEMFIHGSMCMAYSGQCVISNYTQGRDSNRGGCAHSCRFEYSLESQGKKESSFFMSSKDLNGLALLPQYIKCGIDSIKVEGRMKSPLYVATTSAIYACALRYLAEQKDRTQVVPEQIPLDLLQQWQRELTKFSHRDYTEASLVNPAGLDSIHNRRDESDHEYDIIGTVIAVTQEYVIVEVKNFFYQGDVLEVLTFDGSFFTYSADRITDLTSETLIEKTKPSTLVKLPMQNADGSSYPFSKYQMIRCLRNKRALSKNISARAGSALQENYESC